MIVSFNAHVDFCHPLHSTVYDTAYCTVTTATCTDLHVHSICMIVPLTFLSQTMLVVPLYLAMVGAVLQFDSSDSNGGSFPNMVHNQDFEVHLLVEYVGALVAGGFLVRHNFHDNYYGNQLVAFTLYHPKLFQWVALVLWPLHSYKKSTTDYVPINN